MGSLISTLPKYIKCDDEGNSSSDPNFIINELNKDFVSKGSKLVGELPKPKQCSQRYLKKRLKNSMKFKTIKEGEIIKIICQLITGKSSGHDGISAKLEQHWNSALPTLFLY